MSSIPKTHSTLSQLNSVGFWNSSDWAQGVVIHTPSIFPALEISLKITYFFNTRLISFLVVSANHLGLKAIEV